MVSGCLSDPKPGGSDVDTGTKSTTDTSNSAPSIAGSPASAILVGDTYLFRPSASDADGDELTFSISNQPRWANFDSKTGQLTGQILLGDIGVYERIRISVTDGTATASLLDFSITATNSALGSMTLSWAAPIENTDGTPLLDLAGYNLYFGRSRGTYSNQIRIDNPSINIYVVENLLPGTYYIVATSFNAQGDESAYSNEATETVTTP